MPRWWTTTFGRCGSSRRSLPVACSTPKTGRTTCPRTARSKRSTAWRRSSRSVTRGITCARVVRAIARARRALTPRLPPPSPPLPHPQRFGDYSFDAALHDCKRSLPLTPQSGFVCGIPLNARGQYNAMLTCMTCSAIVGKRHRLWSNRLEERVGRLGALQAHLGRIGVALKQRQLDFNQKLEAIRTANGS